MGRRGRPTAGEKSRSTGVMEPFSAKKQRDGLGMTILSEQRPLLVSVEELYHGNPDRYPTVQKYQSSKATLQLVNKRAGIHLKLYKEENLEGIANFKFVEDGEFILEARVYKNKQCLEIFKHSRTSKKKNIYWVIGLGKDRDGTMARTRQFWDALCHYFQNLSLEQLRYVNLPRRKSLVGIIPEADNPSADDTSGVIQNTLVLFVHGDGGPQCAEWVFTNLFAREPFRNMRNEMLEGQIQPQKSKPKKGGRNRRR